MKLFKSKRSIKLDSSSEFSENDLINLCEVSDHSLEDVCQEPEVLAKDLEKSFSANELNVNDFILVVCKGKRKIKYLVAQVMVFELKDVFEVVYLKKVS